MPLNGEVRVVRPDLTTEFDKTQNKRIEHAIEKVIDFAGTELSMEQSMERHLLETKERGNLSFSKDDDFCMVVENETAEASRDHSLVASVTSNDNPLRSQLAVLFEAGKALDRAK